VLGQDVPQELRLVQRNNAGIPIAGTIHAQHLREVTQVLGSECGAKLGFGGSQPSCVVARCGNAIHVKGDHGEDGPGSESIDARVRKALLPPSVDKPVPRQGVELTGGLFKSVGAEFELAHFKRATREAKGLTYVHILFDGGI
jgi:hypothetical protein